MNKLRTTLFTAAIVIAFPATADTASPIFYQEIGDAGDRFSPQPIGPAGTPFSGFSGNIGDGTDFADSYSFFFAGGDLFAKTSVQIAANTFEPLLASVFIPTEPVIPTDPIIPIYSSSNTGVVGWNLAPGNYILETFYKVGDPPISSAVFMLNPDTTTNPTPAVVTAPIPEPHTWALLVTGLMGFAGVVGRKRR
jgi:hypothetical protein